MAVGPKQLVEQCEIAASLYQRLVLLVGPACSGKTRLLQEISQCKNWPIVNLNQRLSERLLDLTQRQRVLRLSRIVGELVEATSADVVLLDNLELLFSPHLAQDPLKLLQGLARNRTIVASWPGFMRGAQLIYAEPSHPEYRRYSELDVLWLSLQQSGDAPQDH